MRTDHRTKVNGDIVVSTSVGRCSDDELETDFFVDLLLQEEKVMLSVCCENVRVDLDLKERPF